MMFVLLNLHCRCELLWQASGTAPNDTPIPDISMHTSHSTHNVSYAFVLCTCLPILQCLPSIVNSLLHNFFILSTSSITRNHGITSLSPLPFVLSSIFYIVYVFVCVWNLRCSSFTCLHPTLHIKSTCMHTQVWSLPSSKCLRTCSLPPEIWQFLFIFFKPMWETSYVPTRLRASIQLVYAYWIYANTTVLLSMVFTTKKKVSQQFDATYARYDSHHAEGVIYFTV